MKQSTTNKVIQTFSQEWCVNEDDLGYVVSNYNPDLLRQDGEAELKSTSDYTKYREINENPVSKLRYWTSLRQKLDETVKGKILPLK